MPEGPELNIAAQFVSLQGSNHVFGGIIEKSEINVKNPEIPFSPSKDGYRLEATSRGKEMKV